MPLTTLEAWNENIVPTFSSIGEHGMSENLPKFQLDFATRPSKQDKRDSSTDKLLYYNTKTYKIP